MCTSQHEFAWLSRAIFAPEAYRDVQVVVDLDDLAEYADPLIEIGKVE